MMYGGRHGRQRARLGAVAGVALALFLSTRPAAAFDIELKDVAPDRVERQRAYALGNLALPGTPDVARLDERLKAAGVTLGGAIFVRIFKAESELELWMQKGDRFVLLDTYPICHWSGSIGPKIREGDKQAPEGFYTVGMRQTRLVGQWRRAFNVGFPNPLDFLLGRTGSNILVHGGCSSVGCFAMTNPVMEEIYKIAQAALGGGQDRFQVHIFPFRMTADNLAAHKSSPWYDGWLDLKIGHDSFNRTQVPPQIGICEQRYLMRDGKAGSSGEGSLFQIMRPRSGSGDVLARCLNDDEAVARARASSEITVRTAAHTDTALASDGAMAAAVAPTAVSPAAGSPTVTSSAPSLVSAVTASPTVPETIVARPIPPAATASPPAKGGVPAKVAAPSVPTPLARTPVAAPAPARRATVAAASGDPEPAVRPRVRVRGRATTNGGPATGSGNGMHAGPGPGVTTTP